MNDFIEMICVIEYILEQVRLLFGNWLVYYIKVIIVIGDSMDIMILFGDEIFVDISSIYFDSDGVYVFVFGKIFYVKCLQM